VGTNLYGSEVGDMCALSEASNKIYQRMVDDFMVQRTWSNRAATTGQDPCVPAISDVYFNAAPDLNDTLFVYSPNDPRMARLLVPTSGVRVPLGESRTIDIRLFSSGPIADWQLGELEYRATGVEPSLQLAFDKVSGGNGDVIRLTITRTADGPLPGGYSEIAIGSAPSAAFTQGTYQRWNMFVGN
jgi:hypothetical protein